MKTSLTLRLSVPRSSRRSVKSLQQRLPDFEGRAIRIRFLPGLTAGSRKLYSKRSYGRPVYAGTFIRKRRMVLDSELAEKPRELARILTHELFHFVWARLGNQKRRSYEELLRQEWKERARGELGWSAESRKSILPRRPDRAHWRDYLCESFCDTAAWMYSGVDRHPEFTLANRHRDRRAEWFYANFEGRKIPI